MNNIIEYPKLLTPACRTRAVEYLNDWIDNVNAWLVAHQDFVVSLNDYHKEIQPYMDSLKNLIEVDIPNLNTAINNIKELPVIDGVLDASKMMEVINAFSFDDVGKIAHANLTFPEYSLNNESEGNESNLIESLEGEQLLILGKDKIGHVYGQPFTGNTKQYLSGNGSWQDVPEFERTLVIPCTRQDLLYKKYYNELVEGAWYRIIDYSTIVLSEGVSSVDIKVDILILATSSNSLNENVYFVKKQEDDLYLIGSNVQAWKGKYCIENNTDRFDFLNSHLPYIVDSNNNSYVRDQDKDLEDLYAWRKITNIYEAKNAVEKGLDFPYSQEELYVYTKEENPTPQYGGTSYMDGYYGSPYEETQSSQLFNAYGNPMTPYYIKSVHPVSKGVIYYLEDEYGNNAPYDFKSIIFTWKNDYAIEVQGYTFSDFAGSTFGTEASLQSNNKVYRNTIKENYTVLEKDSHTYQRLSLNKIAMGIPCVNNNFGVNCSDMFFLKETINNTWEGSSSHNKFYSFVEGNHFYSTCSSNNIKIPFYYNIVKKGFTFNNFELPTYSEIQSYQDVNNLGCRNNTFGSNCNTNNFTMPVIENNIIGNDFRNNICEGSVETWTNGRYTTPNTLFIEANKNLVDCTIQNGCLSNRIKGLCNASVGEDFYNNCIYDMKNCNIGNSVDSCKLQHAEGIVIEGDNHKLNLETTTLKNVTIAYGVSYIKCNKELIKATINRGVEGTDLKELVIVGTGSNPDYVTNYVAKTTEISVEVQVEEPYGYNNY